MKTLYLDCFSGVSGDMIVGALTDLGVQPSTFEWELSKVELGAFHMHFERKSRQGIEGVKFGIHEGATHTHDQDEEPEHEHGPDCDHGDHHHHHHEHHHDEEEAHGHAHGRNHREIRELILSSGLSDLVKVKSLAIFQRIAVAEGKIHGMPPEDVTFHEVGALDSIADIICACVGLEALGVEKVFASRLFDGTGWIQCAHGRFPLPAPATLEILAGIPFSQIDEPFEFITPTGAAIVAEFASSFGPMPTLQVEKVGYGIGTRQLASRPNALRAVLADMEPETPSGSVTQIETNLDDLSPELTGSLIEKCLAAGALDAFLTPVQMKKNRPGVLLTVLAERAQVEVLTDLIFRESTTFGLRFSEKSRVVLDREFRSVQTPFGEVRVKLGFLQGQLVQRSPEFESCRLLGEHSKQPVRVIYEAALSAAQSL